MTFTLELAHKDYFTDTEFRVFLEENGLDADYTYNKAENQLELLQTVLAIFQALINNIELYMKIQTEFTTVSSAYKNLRDRIDELEKRIGELPNYEAVAPTITCLYYN